MSANDEILNALTRHQIFVLRYARGRELKASRFLLGLLEQVAGSIKSAKTEYQLGRAQEQARDLYQYIIATQTEQRDQEFEEWLDFAEYEAEFNGDLLDNVRVGSSIPTRGQLFTAMTTEFLEIPGSPGYPLYRMLKEFDDSVLNLVSNQVRDAAALGYSNRELANKIREIAPSLGRRAETIARTATNHVSNQTRKLSMQENDDVIDGYEWVATLDSRTSLVCAARDGQIYRDLDKDPKPPAHFNCRSTITMVVNPEYDLAQFGTIPEGTRPNKGPVGARNLPASTTFNDWLRLQPEPFQEKILGKARARLFREGKMTLDKFIDDRGRVLTLQELGFEDVAFNKKKPPSVTRSPVKSPVDLSDINFSECTTDELHESLASLHPELYEVVARLPRIKRLINDPEKKRGSYYRGRTQEINQRKSRVDSVFKHEYGHHIDYMMSNTSVQAKPKPHDLIAWSELDDDFIKAFKADRKSLGLAVRKKVDRDAALDRYIEEMFEITRRPHPTIKDAVIESKQIINDDHSGISDIFDAMTNGYAFDRKGWWGHGSKTFKPSRPGSMYKETFANLWAMRNDPVTWAKCERLFPRLCARFDEVIQQLKRNGYR